MNEFKRKAEIFENNFQIEAIFCSNIINIFRRHFSGSDRIPQVITENLGEKITLRAETVFKAF